MLKIIKIEKSLYLQEDAQFSPWLLMNRSKKIFRLTDQQTESFIGFETVTYLAQVGCFDSHRQLKGDS